MIVDRFLALYFSSIGVIWIREKPDTSLTRLSDVMINKTWDDCHFGMDHSGPMGFSQEALSDGVLSPSRVRASSRRRLRVPERVGNARRQRDVDVQHEVRNNVF